MSHILTVLSLLADSSLCPFGANTTLTTSMVCPFSVSKFRPVAKTQTLTDLSSLAEASRFPSVLNATSVTSRVCPFSVSDSCPVATYHPQTPGNLRRTLRIIRMRIKDNQYISVRDR